MAMSDRHRGTAAWQRWDLDDLRDQSSRSARARNQPADAISQNERQALQQLRAEVKAAAHREGYQAGYEEGRERGYAEGLDAGQEAGRVEGLEAATRDAEQALQTRMRKEVARIKPLLASFDDALDQVQQEMAAKLTEFALIMASEVAAAARDARPEAILDIVRDLLHLEPTLTERPRLWLHPDDLERVSAQLGDELTAAGWILQPDDQMTPGGCRASSVTGEFDATWETRLAQLRSAIVETLPPVSSEEAR